jgi:hypothetical protein
MKHLSEGVEYPIWDAIETKNTDPMCQLTLRGIDLDVRNHSYKPLRDVLAQAKIWCGTLLTAEKDTWPDRKTKIPLLFDKQLASSGLSGYALESIGFKIGMFTGARFVDRRARVRG